MEIIDIVRVYQIHIDWITENNLEFDVVENTISSITFRPIPWKIKFKQDKDYTMFMLRWS